MELIGLPCRRFDSNHHQALQDLRHWSVSVYDLFLLCWESFLYITHTLIFSQGMHSTVLFVMLLTNQSFGLLCLHSVIDTQWHNNVGSVVDCC